jgi:hypothetical protein
MPDVMQAKLKITSFTVSTKSHKEDVGPSFAGLTSKGRDILFHIQFDFHYDCL